MSRTVRFSCFVALLLALPHAAAAQGTRLLRQPTISEHHVAFAYGADLWVADRTGGLARRLTSTAAVESEPHFSPDGRFIAFTSNRSGTPAVYVVPVVRSKTLIPSSKMRSGSSMISAWPTISTPRS